MIGALVVILGLGWSWFRHVPLFRLPGDIVIDRPGFKFFLPITTMLLLSALISLVAWVLRRREPDVERISPQPKPIRSRPITQGS